MLQNNSNTTRAIRRLSVIMASCCPPNSIPYVAPPADYKDQGEWIKIDDTLNTYVVGPATATSALIVVHDAFGVNSGRHHQLCDAFAENGWRVYLPDLFGDETPVKDDGKVDFPKLLTFTWSKVGPSLTDKLIPYIEQVGATKIAAVGFCYGMYVVGHLNALGKLVAGGSPHPSMYNLCQYTGENNAAQLVEQYTAPVILLTAGSDRIEEKPGGEVQTILAKKSFGADCFFKEYPEMAHGWVARGDPKDPKIAEQVKTAFEELQSFFQKFLN
jgi:dienelactone hydrolase